VHPERDATEVDDLVSPNEDVIAERAIGRLSEKSSPETLGDPRVDERVEHAQHNAANPTENKAEKDTVDCSVNPGCRVLQTLFVARHPIVLQQPVADQMGDQCVFKRCHGDFVGGFSAVSGMRVLPLVPSGCEGVKHRVCAADQNRFLSVV
jgi:hypothetical protein